MRAYAIEDDFGFEHLNLVERPRPEPGPGDILLRMKAVSPNYRDIAMIRGEYNPNQSLPLIPFSEGVGEVVETGDRVDRVGIGDRVCPIFTQKWLAGRPTLEKFKSALGGPLDGTLTEYMAVPQESVVRAPQHLSDEEAATLACAGVTAWSALAEQGDVQPGQTILTLGTGGVSMFGLLLGKTLGAEVIITSSSDRKLETVAEMGADYCINYEDEPEWGRRAKECTDGAGVHHVLELGGADTLPKSVKATRIGGHISLIGVLAGHVDDFMVTPVLMQNIRIQGVQVGHREMFENMVRAMESHEVQPHVDRVFGFDEVHGALDYMARGKHVGKIAIRVDGG